MEAARDKKILKEYKFTHIISLYHQNCAYFPSSFEYKHLTIENSAIHDTRLICAWVPVCSFIESAKICGGRVLIHCEHGRSRSAVMAIMYIMKRDSCSYWKAESIVKRARPS